VVAFPLTFRKISQEKMKRLHPSLIVLRIQPLPIPPPRNLISRERIIASASMTGVNCTLKQVTREPRAEHIYGQAREEEKRPLSLPICGEVSRTMGFGLSSVVGAWGPRFFLGFRVSFLSPY